MDNHALETGLRPPVIFSWCPVSGANPDCSSQNRRYKGSKARGVEKEKDAEKDHGQNILDYSYSASHSSWRALRSSV